METDRCILLLKAICQGQKKQPRIGLFQAPREMLWFNPIKILFIFVDTQYLKQFLTVLLFIADVSSKDALLTCRSIVQTNLKKTVKNIIPNKTKPITIKNVINLVFFFNLTHYDIKKDNSIKVGNNVLAPLRVGAYM